VTRLDIERTELRNFSADVQAGTARRLDLLRAVESTLAWLERLTVQLNADTTFAEKIAADLDKIEGVLDPDDSLQADLTAAQQGVDVLYRVLIEKRQHGRNDHQLTEEDGIEDAYTEAIMAAANLHNAINTLRWNVAEHDIDATPHEIKDENLISDPNDLRASLLALRS